MKKLMLSAVVLAIGFCVMAGTVFADEKEAKKGEPTTIGKVEVVKEGENITAIKIVPKPKKDAPAVAVEVVLDDKGKELAALEGKIVIVKGTKGDDGKLTVTEFKEKTAPPAKPEAKKEKKAKDE